MAWDDDKRRKSLAFRLELQKSSDSRAFPLIFKLRDQGLSWRKIAARLNSFYPDIRTSTLSKWHHVSVKRCYERCQPDLFKQPNV